MEVIGGTGPRLWSAWILRVLRTLWIIFFALRRKLLLLAGDRLCLALAGAGVGMCALSADRQLATMTQAAVAAQIHQTLDVHRGVAAKVAFHHIIAVNRLANLQDFGVGSWATRRSAGMETFSQISFAFWAPMPWMY
jgi:hypothetical protein